MIALIIVLCALLAGAAAFIFWLLKVLKNTFNITDYLINVVENKTTTPVRQAYNGKYYPAAVIAQVQFDCPTECKIADFSMYEKYKIVGFTIMTTDKMEDYYGKEYLEMLDEELLEELNKPVIFKKAVVFETSEGEWSWKSAS